MKKFLFVAALMIAVIAVIYILCIRQNKVFSVEVDYGYTIEKLVSAEYHVAYNASIASCEAKDLYENTGRKKVKIKLFKSPSEFKNANQAIQWLEGMGYRPATRCEFLCLVLQYEERVVNIAPFARIYALGTKYDYICEWLILDIHKVYRPRGKNGLFNLENWGSPDEYVIYLAAVQK